MSSSEDGNGLYFEDGNGLQWLTNQVLQEFINFFESKDHTNWKSSLVVPMDDHTLLFANVGMLIFQSSIVETLIWNSFFCCCEKYKFVQMIVCRDRKDRMRMPIPRIDR